MGTSTATPNPTTSATPAGWDDFPDAPQQQPPPPPTPTPAPKASQKAVAPASSSSWDSFPDAPKPGSKGGVGYKFRSPAAAPSPVNGKPGGGGGYVYGSPQDPNRAWRLEQASQLYGATPESDYLGQNYGGGGEGAAATAARQKYQGLSRQVGRTEQPETIEVGSGDQPIPAAFGGNPAKAHVVTSEKAPAAVRNGETFRGSGDWQNFMVGAALTPALSLLPAGAGLAASGAAEEALAPWLARTAGAEYPNLEAAIAAGKVLPYLGVKAAQYGLPAMAAAGATVATSGLQSAALSAASPEAEREVSAATAAVRAKSPVLAAALQATGMRPFLSPGELSLESIPSRLVAGGVNAGMTGVQNYLTGQPNTTGDLLLSGLMGAYLGEETQPGRALHAAGRAAIKTAASDAASTVAARAMQPGAESAPVHHSQFQPRDEEGHFAGPPVVPPVIPPIIPPAHTAEAAAEASPQAAPAESPADAPTLPGETPQAPVEATTPAPAPTEPHVVSPYDMEIQQAAQHHEQQAHAASPITPDVQSEHGGDLAAGMAEPTVPNREGQNGQVSGADAARGEATAPIVEPAVSASASATPKPKPEYAGSVGLNTLGLSPEAKAEAQADAEALGLANKPTQHVADIRASARVQGLGVDDLRNHTPGSPPPSWTGTLPEYMPRITDLYTAAKQAEIAARNLHATTATPESKAAYDQATIDRAIAQQHLDAYRNTWSMMGHAAKGPSEPFFGTMAGKSADDILSKPKQPEVIAVPAKSESEATPPTTPSEASPAPTVRRGLNPRSASWGKDNKLVTREEYEATKAAFRKSITKAHTGLDPELVTQMIKMGAFHIEAGLRTYGPWRKTMEGEVGDDIAKTISEGQWQTIYANARTDIEDRVKAAGGVGSTRTSFVEQLGPVLGRQGTADFLNAINEQPNGPDILDRFVSKGKAGLTDAENKAVTRAYLDAVTGVQSSKALQQQQGRPTNANRRTGAMVDLATMAADARRAEASQRSAAALEAKQKAASEAKAQKQSADEAARQQRMTEAQKAKAQKIADAEAAREAARMESAKPVNRFLSGLQSRMGKAGADNFKATVGTDLLSRFIEGSGDVTAAERQKIADAYLSNLRQGTARGPVNPVASAQKTLQGAVKDARAKLEAQRVASLRPSDVVKEQLLRLNPATDPNSPEYRDYVSKLNSDLDAIGNDPRKLANYLSQQSATLGKNLLAYYRSNLLSGPQTLGKIGLAHTLYLAAEELKRAPAAAFDRTLSRTTTGHGPQVQGVSLGEAGNAIRAGVGKGGREALQILKGGEASLLLQGHGQASLAHGGTPGMESGGMAHPANHIPIEFAVNGAAGAVVNPAVRIPMRIHGALYHMMNTGALERGLAEQAFLEAHRQITAENPNLSGAALNQAVGSRAMQLRANPSDDMLKAAMAYKAEQTFTNENAATKASTAAMNSVRKTSPGVAKAAELAGGVAVPFQRVPMNVMGKGLEYVGGAPYAVSRALAARIAGKEITPEQQRIWSNTFGRGVVGAGSMAIGYALAHGILPGVSVNPADPKDHRYGTVTVGGRDWSTGGVQPAFAPLSTGARISKQGVLPGVAGGLWDAVSDNPYLRLADTTGNTAEMFGQMQHGNFPGAAKAAGKSIVGNVATGFVPYSSLLSGAAAQFDPTGNLRKVGGVGDALSKVLPWGEFGPIPGRYSLPVTPYPEGRGLVPFLPSVPTKE